MTKTKTLTEGTPWKQILLFSIPIFWGNVFQLLYSLVDTKIVGSTLGTEALAAVGSVSTLHTLMTGFLEASGTDLATEFANMIIYQRGYQANTRIVTVTDTMLEELVNMKR